MMNDDEIDRRLRVAGERARDRRPDTVEAQRAYRARRGGNVPKTTQRRNWWPALIGAGLVGVAMLGLAIYGPGRSAETVNPPVDTAAGPVTTSQDDEPPGDDTVTTLGPDGTGSVEPAEDAEPPDPTGLSWLAPLNGIDGFDLVEADRYLSADCGPTTSCSPYLPAARLWYQAASGEAELTIEHRYPSPMLETPTVTGHVSMIEAAGRSWTVGTLDLGGGISTVEAVSVAADGVVTVVRSTGSQALDLAPILATLSPTAPDEWPTPTRQPYTPDELSRLQDRCVDDDARWAPTFIPSGWTRYVLGAQPDGSCDPGSFLWLSFARPPGEGEEHGELIGFFVQAAYGQDPGPGVDTSIGDLPARVADDVAGPHGPETLITTFVGDVQIQIQGPTDRSTLEAILSSIQLLDADEWATYLAATEVPAAD